MIRKAVFFLLLPLFFAGCNSMKKLLQAGEVARADLDEPLEFEYRDKLLFVDVLANGRPMRFIIDSGAPTVIDERLKEELGLKTVKESEVSDSQKNRSRLEFVKLESLAFAGVEVRNSAAVAADLSLFHCLGIDGLLGANVMSHFDWEVDYQLQKIRLYPKRGGAKPARAYPIALPFETKAQGTPVLQVALPGLLPAATASLDLGSARGISLQKIPAPVGMEGGRRTFSYGRLAKGIYGYNTDTTFFYLADSLLIGGQHFGKAVAASYNTGNRIGNRFLENYRIFISWSDKRLYFAPQNTPPAQLPAELAKIGYEDGAVRILAVYQRMAEINDRIEAGDEVIQINGAAAGGISLESYCALREQEWEKLELQVRKKEGGEIFEITLRKGEVEW